MHTPRVESIPSAQAANPPRRIASLLASATEILHALGLEDRLVAISHECDYPRSILNRPRVTATAIQADSSADIDVQVRELLAAGNALYCIDTELLVRLAPDLIVTQAQCDVCAIRYDDVLAMIRDHAALAQTRVVALNPNRLSDIFLDILQVGSITGRDETARQYVASLKARVAAVEEKTSRLARNERPRVACIEWLEPLMLAANWTPELVELAGGVQICIGGRHSRYHSWQELVDFDPEVILVMPCGFDLERAVREAAVLFHQPGWSDLTAVRRKRVVAVDGNVYFNRSGPRIVDSLELMAGLLHPRMFGIPDEQRDGLAVWRSLV